MVNLLHCDYYVCHRHFLACDYAIRYNQLHAIQNGQMIITITCLKCKEIIPSVEAIEDTTREGYIAVLQDHECPHCKWLVDIEILVHHPVK